MERVMIEFITTNWSGIITAITAVVAAASAIAAVTPTPKDNKIIATIYKILGDIPALNIGKAKE